MAKKKSTGGPNPPPGGAPPGQAPTGPGGASDPDYRRLRFFIELIRPENLDRELKKVKTLMEKVADSFVSLKDSVLNTIPQWNLFEKTVTKVKKQLNPSISGLIQNLTKNMKSLNASLIGASAAWVIARNVWATARNEFRTTGNVVHATIMAIEEAENLFVNLLNEAMKSGSALVPVFQQILSLLNKFKYELVIGSVVLAGWYKLLSIGSELHDQFSEIGYQIGKSRSEIIAFEKRMALLGTTLLAPTEELAHLTQLAIQFGARGTESIEGMQETLEAFVEDAYKMQKVLRLSAEEAVSLRRNFTLLRLSRDEIAQTSLAMRALQAATGATASEMVKVVETNKDWVRGFPREVRGNVTKELLTVDALMKSIGMHSDEMINMFKGVRFFDKEAIVQLQWLAGQGAVLDAMEGKYTEATMKIAKHLKEMREQMSPAQFQVMVGKVSQILGMNREQVIALADSYDTLRKNLVRVQEEQDRQIKEGKTWKNILEDYQDATSSLSVAWTRFTNTLSNFMKLIGAPVFEEFSKLLRAIAFGLGLIATVLRVVYEGFGKLNNLLFGILTPIKQLVIWGTLLYGFKGILNLGKGIIGIFAGIATATGSVGKAAAAVTGQLELFTTAATATAGSVSFLARVMGILKGSMMFLGRIAPWIAGLTAFIDIIDDAKVGLGDFFSLALSGATIGAAAGAPAGGIGALPGAAIGAAAGIAIAGGKLALQKTGVLRTRPDKDKAIAEQPGAKAVRQQQQLQQPQAVKQVQQQAKSDLYYFAVGLVEIFKTHVFPHIKKGFLALVSTLTKWAIGPFKLLFLTIKTLVVGEFHVLMNAIIYPFTILVKTLKGLFSLIPQPVIDAVSSIAKSIHDKFFGLIDSIKGMLGGISKWVEKWITGPLDRLARWRDKMYGKVVDVGKKASPPPAPAVDTQPGTAAAPGPQRAPWEPRGNVGRSPSAGAPSAPQQAPGAPGGKVDFWKVAESLSAKFGVPADIVKAVMRTEGAGTRLGGSGEVGPMQVMPDTAAQYGITPEMMKADPTKGIEAGVRYLADLYKAFSGQSEQTEKTIAAYNHGLRGVQSLVAQWGDKWKEHLPKNVNKYGVPYDTGAYLKKTMKNLEMERAAPTGGKDISSAAPTGAKSLDVAMAPAQAPKAEAPPTPAPAPGGMGGAGGGTLDVKDEGVVAAIRQLEKSLLTVVMKTSAPSTREKIINAARSSFDPYNEFFESVARNEV